MDAGHRKAQARQSFGQLRTTMLAAEIVFETFVERTHAGFMKGTFATGTHGGFVSDEPLQAHSSQWVALLNFQSRPSQPHFGRMLLSMRRLLAGAEEPEAETFVATIGSLFW